MPGAQYFVDDLLKIADRHLLVAEYEMHAHGNPEHGAQQAADYRRELERLRRLRNWTIDALVIAEDFDQAELKAAQRLDVECIRAGVDEEDDLVLTLEGSVQGPAWQARARALA